MFNLNVRLQIASLFFLFIILYNYLRTNKLPLLSTKFFTMFIYAATINLFADIGTVYTITHMDTVPAWLNRLTHQVFILSLNICIVGLFLYVSALGKSQKRFGFRGMLVRLLPFFISLIFIIFGRLYYFNNGVLAYSYGPMAITVYSIIAVYMTMIIYNTLHYKEVLAPKIVTSILTAITIWILLAFIQFFQPGLLLSGLGSIAMVLFLYLSFENPKEHIDQDVGCFNQRAFRLIVAEAVNSGKPFYIINAVVDDLATINKHFGRNNGNLVLEKVVKMNTTTCNHIYRSHTNCLTWVLRGSEDEILAHSQAVAKLFGQSIRLGTLNITVNAHIDILKFPQYAKTEDEIYDILNYMAEQSNPSENFIRLINEDHVKNQRRTATIETMLRDAIAFDGFDIHYQPIYSVFDGTFVSAEALVRLRDKITLGYVPPDEFIRIAERRGLITELGAIVFDKVCAFMRTNQLTKHGVSYIEVNLSGLQCLDFNLPSQLHGIMQRHGIAPECINLEITETASVESGELLIINMEKLRELGCSFSMDDFGTGYSNLSQMADVSYDLVKIDKSLVWRCFESNNEKAVTVLKNVVAMLMSLDVKIVAEGVETEEQAHWLKQLGIDYLQGYFFSKPIEESAYLNFLSTLRTESVS